jgi:transcriptional regulator with XRE-family HTH domain
LQPGEILAIRESLGYSQARFEKLLRVGQKTVVRWEKGTVFQSATADQLMRLVRDVPAVADVLSGRRLKTTVTCHAGTAANVLDEDWQEELTATSRMRDQDECPALAA